jgi:hypothetical protein
VTRGQSQAAKTLYSRSNEIGGTPLTLLHSNTTPTMTPLPQSNQHNLDDSNMQPEPMDGSNTIDVDRQEQQVSSQPRAEPREDHNRPQESTSDRAVDLDFSDILYGMDSFYAIVQPGE